MAVSSTTQPTRTAVPLNATSWPKTAHVAPIPGLSAHTYLHTYIHTYGRWSALDFRPGDQGYSKKPSKVSNEDIGILRYLATCP